MTIDVIALPGGVMPAELRYKPVQAAVGDDFTLHWKDLEVYAGDAPPAGYSIQMEVDALARFADSLGLERFHLLGYSGGGFVSLAFAGAHPERLRSFAVFEPASIPGPMTPPEADLWTRLEDGLRDAEGQRFMQEFMRIQVRPGVVLDPPPSPAPPWMAKRPAGLAAMMRAIQAHPFDRECLRRLEGPVFYGYGALSGEHEEIRAAILATLLRDIHVRRFEGIHHFVPADKLYTPEHLQELGDLWTKAGA